MDTSTLLCAPRPCPPTRDSTRPAVQHAPPYMQVQVQVLSHSWSLQAHSHIQDTSPMLLVLPVLPVLPVPPIPQHFLAPPAPAHHACEPHNPTLSRTVPHVNQPWTRPPCLSSRALDPHTLIAHSHLATSQVLDQHSAIAPASSACHSPPCQLTHQHVAPMGSPRCAKLSLAPLTALTPLPHPFPLRSI